MEFFEYLLKLSEIHIKYTVVGIHRFNDSVFEATISRCTLTGEETLETKLFSGDASDIYGMVGLYEVGEHVFLNLYYSSPTIFYDTETTCMRFGLVDTIQSKFLTVPLHKFLQILINSEEITGKLRDDLFELVDGVLDFQNNISEEVKLYLELRK